MWHGVSGDLLIGPYIFLCLTGDIYANFLQISWWEISSGSASPAIALNITQQTASDKIHTRPVIKSTSAPLLSQQAGSKLYSYNISIYIL
jgi:hypothetical protein